MDKQLFVLMLIACFCGSIRNAWNQPAPFEGRLAKATDGSGPRFSIPHYVHYYPTFGVDVDSNANNYDIGEIWTI